MRDGGDGRRKGNLCFALKADAGRSLINVGVQQPPSCLSTTAICSRFLTGPEDDNTDRRQLCNFKAEVENNSVLGYISPKSSLLVLELFLHFGSKEKIAPFPFSTL